MQAVTRAILVSLPLYVLPSLTIAAFAAAHDNAWLVGVGGLTGLLTFVWLVVTRFVPGRSFHDFAARTTVVVVAEPEIA
jgi:hypothetical protein